MVILIPAVSRENAAPSVLTLPASPSVLWLVAVMDKCAHLFIPLSLKQSQDCNSSKLLVVGKNCDSLIGTRIVLS